MPTMVTAVDGNVADPNTGNAKSGNVFKSYVALLTQEGTDAPTAIILNALDDNFLGEIVWTRLSVGSYLGTLTGQLSLNKTALYLSNSNSPLKSVAILDTEDGNGLTIDTAIPGTGHVDNVLYRSTVRVDVYQN